MASRPNQSQNAARIPYGGQLQSLALYFIQESSLITSPQKMASELHRRAASLQEGEALTLLTQTACMDELYYGDQPTAPKHPTLDNFGSSVQRHAASAAALAWLQNAGDLIDRPAYAMTKNTMSGIVIQHPLVAEMDMAKIYLKWALDGKMIGTRPFAEIFPLAEANEATLKTQHLLADPRTFFLT